MAFRRWVSLCISVKLQLKRWLYLAHALTKPYQCVLVVPTYPSDRDLVSILQESPHLPTAESYRFLAVLTLFKEASVFCRRVAAYRARAEQVARLERATIDGVVCEHLRE